MMLGADLLAFLLGSGLAHPLLILVALLGTHQFPAVDGSLMRLCLHGISTVQLVTVAGLRALLRAHSRRAKYEG